MRGGEGSLPGGCAVIRTLPAHLELQPLVELMPLPQRVVRERLVHVVLLDDVLDDGPGLPERDVGIGVFDCWIFLLIFLG